MNKGQRRALTHVGGAVDREGDPELARALATALEVSSADPESALASTRAPVVDAYSLGKGRRRPLEAVRPHVHGFHVYPARLHPDTAAGLIDSLSNPGQVVLDPFVGSGTVAVEALAAGRLAVGNDLNPLAVAIARCKVHAWTREELAELASAATVVAASADERRRKKEGAHVRYSEEDVRSFPPHVLLELDGLRGAIFDLRSKAIRRTLLLVLSSILTKLSYSRGDAAHGQTDKRIPSGQAIRMFQLRAQELGSQLVELGTKVRDAHGGKHPGGAIFQDDARTLAEVKPNSVHLVVSSPPYAGTYDYLAHHEAKLRWLDLPADAFAAGELGARRNYVNLSQREAERRWDRDLHQVLVALSRVMITGARAVLILGDSAVGGQVLRADDVVAHAAEGTGLVPSARASQDRPHFHAPTAHLFAKHPRREHALLLVKASAKS